MQASFIKLHLRFLLSFVSLFCWSALSVAQEPQVASGTIQRVVNFPSTLVTPRTVDIWLPPSYSPKQKYAVLYMHDGQMLFDSSQTWNHQAWDVDDILTQLFTEQHLMPVIVIGIWNSGKERHADYFPQKVVSSLSPAQHDSLNAQLQRAGRTTGVFNPQSDAYLAFIVNELKPYVDSTYSVYTDAAHTFIAGSSMGGLISMYAQCEYPQVFGGAACLSTHWLGSFTNQHNAIPDAFIAYLKNHLPPANSHRWYFDCGDQTLDTYYPEIQHRVDEVLKAKGYTSSHWMTRYYPGENHSEQAWRKRLAVPLRFLLKH